MKRAQFLLLATIAFVSAAIAAPRSSAEDANITAILIEGSNNGGGVDGPLRGYERHLKRMLPFDTFRQKGQGSAHVSLPGSGKISVGGGQAVAVSVEDAGGNRLRIATQWKDGGRTLINTTIVSARGQPTVLGGPSAGKGRLILLLIAR